MVFCCRLCFNENFLATFQVFGDVPHVKTGATALHVSGAKGYIKVMGILLQAGAAVNVRVSFLMFTFLIEYEEPDWLHFMIRILLTLEFHMQ